jgi:hypothetical protein
MNRFENSPTTSMKRQIAAYLPATLLGFGVCLVSSQQVIQGPVKEIANEIVKLLNTVELQRSQLTSGNSVA